MSLIFLRRIVFANCYYNVIYLLQLAPPPFKAPIFCLKKRKRKSCPCERKSLKYLVKDNNLYTNLATFCTKFKPGFENVLVKAAVNLLQGHLGFSCKTPTLSQQDFHDREVRASHQRSPVFSLLANKIPTYRPSSRPPCFRSTSSSWGQISAGYADLVVSIIAV